MNKELKKWLDNFVKVMENMHKVKKAFKTSNSDVKDDESFGIKELPYKPALVLSLINAHRNNLFNKVINIRILMTKQ